MNKKMIGEAIYIRVSDRKQNPIATNKFQSVLYFKFLQGTSSFSKSQLVHLNHIMSIISQRFLCRPTVFFPTCWSSGTSESSTYEKQRICPRNSALAHFHVSWLLVSRDHVCRFENESQHGEMVV
jgi:hypothetical protein